MWLYISTTLHLLINTVPGSTNDLANYLPLYVQTWRVVFSSYKSGKFSPLHTWRFITSFYIQPWRIISLPYTWRLISLYSRGELSPFLTDVAKYIHLLHTWRFISLSLTRGELYILFFFHTHVAHYFFRTHVTSYLHFLHTCELYILVLKYTHITISCKNGNSRYHKRQHINNLLTTHDWNYVQPIAAYCNIVCITQATSEHVTKSTNRNTRWECSGKAVEVEFVLTVTSEVWFTSQWVRFIVWQFSECVSICMLHSL